ncbi:hypothetical protein K4G64_03445 [Streptomyces sp. WAC04114]|nr:hypothetical protein [Streptomyces sp. WAC04114]
MESVKRRRARAPCPRWPTTSAKVHARHPGLGGEGDPLGTHQLALVALAQPVLLLGENHDGAAFGCLVGQRRELRRVGHLRLGRAAHGHELGGLPVAQGDGAGLVQQQRRDVTGGLDRSKLTRC